jgi:hypothetical protein
VNLRRPLPTLARAACLAAVLLGCERPTAAPERVSSNPLPTALAWRAIIPEVIPTYDGSGEVVHPDVVYTPPGVFAHTWHLVLTPYPTGAGALYENPSVYASDDGVAWHVESGVVNPLARPRPQAHGEVLSDPALVFVPESGELWLYYRSYTSDSDYVWLMRTSDAVHWSSPVLVFGTAAGQALSPSVVHRTADEWLMWTVSGHCDGGGDTHMDVRRSADGLRWSPPETVILAGLSPWHVFVRWVESLSTWVLATNVKTDSSSCLTTELHLAFSSDGLRWTLRSHAWLVAGEDPTGMFSRVVYRSAFAEVGNNLRFWYSGAAMKYVTSVCRKGQEVCGDSVLQWSSLGTEIRPTTAILAGPIR